MDCSGEWSEDDVYLTLATSLTAGMTSGVEGGFNTSDNEPLIRLVGKKMDSDADFNSSDDELLCQYIEHLEDKMTPLMIPPIDQGMRKTVIELMIIMIIIALKGAIRDFLQSPHSAANCLQHVRSCSPGASVCKSRATHRALITCKCHVTCHLVRRDSSAVKFDGVEIAFELYFIG